MDHGAVLFIPLNVGLICLTAVRWSEVYPWWGIVPIALIITAFAFDQYGGMFFVFLAMLPLAVMSPGITGRLLALKADSQPTAGAAFCELVKVGGVVLLVVGVLTGIGFCFERVILREDGAFDQDDQDQN
jgi:hypothetical protein